MIKKNGLRKYSSVSNLLDDTPTTYYYAGLLMADGNLEKGRPRISYSVSSKDRVLVQRLHEFLGPVDGHNVKDYMSTNGYECSGIKFMDTLVVPEFCSKFDLKPNKSKNPPEVSVFSGMSDDLFMAFLCGFIDGDGSIGRVLNRNYFNLTIKCHSSWENILIYFCKRLLGVLSEEYKQLVRYYDGYPCLVISKYSIISRMKYYFSERLGINPLERKWGEVEIGYASRNELARKTDSVILSMEGVGFSDEEISLHTGVTQAAIRTRRYRRKHND